MLNDIDMQIFCMVYYGHFSYMDCESMTLRELRNFYRLLQEAQRKESEALKGIR